MDENNSLKKTFVNILSRLNYKGKVVDYYDSHGIMRAKSGLNRYTIDTKPVKNLVSYLSVVYNDNLCFKLNPFDIKLAIGAVKSVITSQMNNLNHNIELPSWSLFHKMKNGVFVGTNKTNGRPNCSRGSYERSGATTAQLLIEAAGTCKRDSIERWGGY